MNFALQNAANELKDEIEKYGIIVDARQDIIGWDDGLTRISSSSSREICKRYLRSYIKQAQEKEAKRLADRQPSLFGDLL